MGRVYRARDAKLNRDVAVKVLLPEVAHDADRLARFRREAQVLAALNHQNIAHIHGFEDAGEHHALVMELVEGPTLADRVATGALPLDEALAIAKQIADALEAAHDQGIIHRDLKPANVKVRPDGTVKVLDFGLAKVLEQGARTGHPEGKFNDSPTFTAAMTMPGVMLGTAAYMPPEQVKGKPVDKRADIWGFGCVLFEMLTGQRPFQGETTTDVLAKVIEREPDWKALPAGTPQSIQSLLRRCLVKDPKRRLDSAAVARLDLEDALTSPSTGGLAPKDAVRGPGWPSWAVVAVGLLTAVAGAIAAWMVTRSAETPAGMVSRFAITLPPAQPIAFSFNDRDVAISADGTHLAYTAGDQAQLMVRALDQLEAAPLAGIVNARAPFFSPDSRWIGFFERLDEAQGVGAVIQRGALKRVPTNGGPATTISRLTGASRGASWVSDDLVVFATNDPSTGLLRVAMSGGEPAVLTKPDPDRGEKDHVFPSVLPGGSGVLFTIIGNVPSDRHVAVLDLTTGQHRTLIRSGGQAGYVETGHLIYADGRALWAIRFDLSKLDVVGDAVPLVEDVLTLGATAFTISRRGTLVYVPVRGDRPRSLVWVSRQGVEEPIAAPLRSYINVNLSPDAKRIAAQISDQGHHIFTWDFDDQTLSRLTFGPYSHYQPHWTPDGHAIVFGSPRDAPGNLYRRMADGAGVDEQLMKSSRLQRPSAISPDGAWLVFEELTPSAGYDLMLLSLKGTPRVEPLLSTPFDERDATISPDGRWMAYESNQSGQSQVYVRPFPIVGTQLHQISTAGGRTPLWSPTGRELFFVDYASVLAVPVRVTPGFSAGNPTRLFDTRSFVVDARFVGGGTPRTYDVSPDGQRFLMIKENAASEHDAAPPSMIVVQNWTEELKRLLPRQ